MKFGVIALLRTKWHISLLRYDSGTLFFYISSNKTDTNNFIFSPNVTQTISSKSFAM